MKCLMCKSEPLWRLLSWAPEMAEERDFLQRELTAWLKYGSSTKDKYNKKQ